jgi:hypothetical protein
LDLGVLTPGASLTADGCIIPAEDVDYYVLVVEEAMEVAIETFGNSSGDSYLYLYDEEVEEIDYDDDSGEGSWSRIEEELLPGTYYIKVESFWAANRSSTPEGRRSRRGREVRMIPGFIYKPNRPRLKALSLPEDGGSRAGSLPPRRPLRIYYFSTYLLATPPSSPFMARFSPFRPFLDRKPTARRSSSCDPC